MLPSSAVLRRRPIVTLNSDQVRFRELYLDSYEDHWYNVSTLKLDANECGFQSPISDIEHNFLSLDHDLKNLLKPIQIKEKIEQFKKRYLPYITIKRLGDKDTWDEIDKIGVEQWFLDDKIGNASIIVCMVEVVNDKGTMCVSKPSLSLLKKCLFTQPDDTEIVIITQAGIYATESKRIVYETLKAEKIELPKAVHHAAETDIHDIVLSRVNFLIENIGKLAKTLEESLPESKHTGYFVTEAFEEHASEQNILKVAKRLNQTDEDSKQQLFNKCIETVLEELKDEIGNKINSHIVANLHFSDEISSFYQKQDILKEFFGPLLTLIFQRISIQLHKSLSIATAVFGSRFPAVVNDPNWRTRNVVTNFQNQKGDIISITSSSLNEKFSKMSSELHSLRLQSFVPYRHQHHGYKEHGLYSKSTFHDHQKSRKEYKLWLMNTELKQHVKIVVGHDLSVTIYTTDTTTLPKKNLKSKIQQKQIMFTTDEDRRINSYLLQKQPTIEPKKRHEISKVISKITTRFFTMHSNLSIIEPSAVKSTELGKNIKECPCIAFVCIGKGKIPIGESYFPKQIEGIEIDVREGFYIPLTCIRCSVGMYEEESSGSFGFLANKSGFLTKQGIITAAHVAVDNNILQQNLSIELQKKYVSEKKRLLVSPSNMDKVESKEKRIYGFVSDMHCGEWQNGNSKYGVDAAFVEKKEESSVNLNFHFSSGILSDPKFRIKNMNSNVEKCGRTTGQTKGKLNQTGCSLITSNPFYIVLKNQYKIIQSSETNQDFAQQGDSGSGVYLVEEGYYHPIGIVVGRANGNVYVTPIKYILEALDLEMFPVGMEYDSDTLYQQHVLDERKAAGTPEETVIYSINEST